MREAVRLSCDVHLRTTPGMTDHERDMTDHADDDAAVGLPVRRPRTIPEPEPRTSHGPAKVVAMCNQKGGVGKTTSTINLGAALAEYGRRGLLVDMDPQGALSGGVGGPHHCIDKNHSHCAGGAGG